MDSTKDKLYALKNWIFANNLRRVVIYEKHTALWQEIRKELTLCSIPCFLQDCNMESYGVYLSQGMNLCDNGFDGYCFWNSWEFELTLKHISNKHLQKFLILPVHDDRIEEKVAVKKFPFFTEKQVLRNQEIQDIFIKALTFAETEIDIASPWVNRGAVNDKVMNLLRQALQREVLVKIAYGIGGDSEERNAKSMAMISYMQEHFKSFGSLFRVKHQNSHAKLLICDTKFYIIGSYNFLSFYGNYGNETTQEECCEYNVDIDALIHNRIKAFNF